MLFLVGITVIVFLLDWRQGYKLRMKANVTGNRTHYLRYEKYSSATNALVFAVWANYASGWAGFWCGLYAILSVIAMLLIVDEMKHGKSFADRLKDKAEL